jgi:hypothetical protein
VRSLAGIGGLILAVACSSGSSSFNVGNATVEDTTYTCPAGSTNATYQLHARFEAHNPTSAAVTIRSVTATLKLGAVKGAWLEKVGDTYDAGTATFTPTSVGAGANATVKVTIASACTSAKTPAATSSYGEYQVTLHVTTSSGSFNTATGNRHRIVAS